jgi:hypothetical protein
LLFQKLSLEARNPTLGISEEKSNKILPRHTSICLVWKSTLSAFNLDSSSLVLVDLSKLLSEKRKLLFDVILLLIFVVFDITMIYNLLERLVRASASPTRSDPEGSSRNETRSGRFPASHRLFVHNKQIQQIKLRHLCQ